MHKFYFLSTKNNDSHYLLYQYSINYKCIFISIFFLYEILIELSVPFYSKFSLKHFKSKNDTKKELFNIKATQDCVVC